MVYVYRLITSIMIMIAEINGQNFVPPPNVCNGEVLCDSVPGYPNDQVTAAVKANEESLKDFFDSKPLQDGLILRIGNPESIALCASRTETRYPQAGETSRGDNRYIVNNNEYKQGLTVEVCAKTDDKCQFADSFPNGYQATCTQKFISRRLVALDNKGQSVVDDFQIPSCCVCSVIFNKN